ncbi:MAG: zf-TFIIB domain-containing protein [Dehalococcoidales bacterium]|nr:MAG: zf-TFIIB domain-containing protein [Dehalococcoidales bacterium]
MICPKCKSDTIVVEHENIELDYCTGCEGAWFDAGEMELLLESLHLESPSQFLNEMVNSKEVRSSEKARKCPICNHNMKKVDPDPQAELIIDVCDRGDGLWLDGGEVHHLIRLLGKQSVGKPGAQQKVISFLGEVFKAQE